MASIPPVWLRDCRRTNTRLRTQRMVHVGFSGFFVITWSVYAEPGSGGIQRHARNRLTQIQPWFRRSPMWGFWSLNRLLYSTLFFKNLVRRKAGIKTASSANDPDAFTRHFGTAQPSSIPECTSATNTPYACVATHRFLLGNVRAAGTEWWKRQQKETADRFKRDHPSVIYQLLCFLCI